ESSIVKLKIMSKKNKEIFEKVIFRCSKAFFDNPKVHDCGFAVLQSERGKRLEVGAEGEISNVK
ncbi:MAG: hypothetical protein ACE5I8_07765, partial [Thermodesulfobacteriota bacterium]